MQLPYVLYPPSGNMFIEAILGASVCRLCELACLFIAAFSQLSTFTADCLGIGLSDQQPPSRLGTA